MTPQESRGEKGAKTSTEQGKYRHLKREMGRRGRGTNKAEKGKQFLKSMKDTRREGPLEVKRMFSKEGVIDSSRCFQSG